MPDETKGTNPPNPEPPKAPAAPTPASGAQPPATAPKPPAAAAPPKPAVPPKPAGPVPTPWESELIADLKRRYGSGIREALVYQGQKYMVVERSAVHEVLSILRDEQQFDYCVDVTAVHYPKREQQQFDIVWILYSFAKNERIRVKTTIGEGEAAPSATDIWPSANWLERECFDMFGIQFEGHPDLRRILLPDGWKGHPLRKDYGILQQDKEWVQANLGIESGQ